MTCHIWLNLTAHFACRNNRIQYRDSKRTNVEVLPREPKPQTKEIIFGGVGKNVEHKINDSNRQTDLIIVRVEVVRCKQRMIGRPLEMAISRESRAEGTDTTMERFLAK